MVLEHNNVLENNSTTFERISFNKVNVYSSLNWEEVIINTALRPMSFQNVMEKRDSFSLFTNFSIAHPDNLSDLTNSSLIEDFDFYIPLKPKMSFKVKAHIKSVEKFTPKPFFD